jgi:hypothetical protein
MKHASALLKLAALLALAAPLVAEEKKPAPTPAPAPEPEAERRITPELPTPTAISADPGPARAGTPMDNSGLPPAPRQLEAPPSAAGSAVAPGAGQVLEPEQIQGIIRLAEEAEFEKILAQLLADGRLRPQTVFEMRLLRAWQNENLAQLKELTAPGRLEKEGYEATGSLFFSTADQLSSFISLLKALIAAREGDESTLKTASMEAIWLFPEHAPMVADLIADYRRRQALAKLTVNLDEKFPRSAGEPVTLRELVKGRKALLLYFWSTWAAPSVERLPAQTQVAERLLPQGIVTIGINTEAEAAPAEKVRAERKIPFPWLVNGAGSPVLDALQLDSIPWIAVVSPEGKVLFSGAPEDLRLQDALKGLGVSL